MLYFYSKEGVPPMKYFAMFSYLCLKENNKYSTLICYKGY